jgi:O-antigen ligase
VYGVSATLNIGAIVESFGLSSYLRTESLEDASGRTEVWAVAIEEIKNQPWLGKGILYDNHFINYYGERHIGEIRARHWYGIWNSYLSLLLNVGILGVVAFSFFWYKMFALSQMKIIRLAFLMLCLFSAISESWMAASMNAFTPLVFLCWAIQMHVPKPLTKDL